MLRLLLVTHYYPSHLSGIEIVAGKIVEHLLKNKDYSIRWIASNSTACPGLAERLECLPIETCNFIENILGLPFPIWNPLKILQISKSVKNADLVFLHDYLYLGNICVFFFAKIYQKPIVVMQHIGHVPYKNPLLNFILEFLNRTLGKILLRNADQVVFCSETVKSYFMQRMAFKNKPVVISNGVDLTTFYPLKNYEREILKNKLASSERPVFLFVGRFVEKKGLPFLQKLAEHFKSIDWVFIGRGPMNPRNWAFAHVKVLENQTFEQIRPYYQIADLLVLPSFGEGFPLVIQEAMACGTPALSGDEIKNAHPLIQNYLYCLPVHGGNALTLWIQKIEELLMARHKWQEVREKIARFAFETWSWDKTVQSYDQLFHNLMLKKVTRHASK